MTTLRKLAILFTCGVISLAGPWVRAADPSPRLRPNIVIILADDMGFSDIGCYGSEIATPHLDRLAREGLRFTQFYNGARCCPTRAALLTGLYAHQAGVGHMVDNRGTPAYQGYLNDHCVTIAEVLRDQGYTTMMSGKWHVGENRPHWPADRGFERYFGLISGASSYFTLDAGRKMALGNEPYTPPTDGFYMTDAIADHAVTFIEEWKGTKSPFFLYMAFTAPHWPLHAPAEVIAKYRGKYLEGWDRLRAQRHQRQIELGIVDSRWPLTPRDAAAPDWNSVTNKEELDLRMAVYAAQIDRLDQGVGRVLEKIRQLGVETNTLVLFLADNGGCAEKVERGKPGAAPGSPDSYTSYGLPWANASNTPFRLYKHWVHEGGIATPLIAWWPAVISQQGAITRQPGHLIDLMATCLDVAGAPYPTTFQGRSITPSEGQSLQPVFRGAPPTERTLFWEHEGNRAVRQGHWKLVSKYPGTWELFDLEADRTELRNQAAANPAKVTELTTVYDAWAKRAGVEPWKRIQSATNLTRANPDPYYLFTSFRGNGESGLYLALSRDGYHWTNLNHDQSLLRPEIGEYKLMRDPCLARGPKGTYHLVWTAGWTADKTKVLGYANSRDLIRWSPQQGIPVMENEPLVKNIWAPEVFYDEAKTQWLIFWSSTVPGKFPETDATGDDGYNHRVYYITTKDFKTFSPTKMFFNPGFNVIDATLLKAGDKYYLLFKDERKNPVKKNLRYAAADHAEGPYGMPSEPFTIDWVEGPSAIKIKDEYMVYFDHYTRPQYYGAVRSKDLVHWEDCSKEMNFPPGQRHGTVLQIPSATATGLLKLSAATAASKRP